MTTPRRRTNVAANPKPPTSKQNAPDLRTVLGPSSHSRPITIAAIVAMLGTTFLWLVKYYITISTIPVDRRAILLSTQTESDAEDAISHGVIPFEDDVPAQFANRTLACMPTVTRGDGSVEYVSNAVKSWRLATNGSTDLRRLVVFDMDIRTGSGHRSPLPSWIHSVFSKAAGWDGVSLPSWLSISYREEGELSAPRKLTLGDSEERVRWRSKEALDYAQVLRRCTQAASGRFVIVVQDDVLFSQRIKEVVAWCEAHMEESVFVNEQGRMRMIRYCSASLFDLPDSSEKQDGQELSSSNMVARVWEVERARAFVKYITSNYDEAPVDWLADRMCKSQRRKTVVMHPNAVRHRGVVSSFEKNQREGTLT